MITPRIKQVHPLAGVEGGRVSILGEELTGDIGLPAPRFDSLESRPLIASPTRILVPIPESAVSGFLAVAWPETVVQGPYFEVAEKLAEELHPVANPVVDRQGTILTTFSGSRGQAAPGGVSVFRIPPGRGAEPYLSDLVNPTGLALDPEGSLYISCRNDGTIRKVADPARLETVIEGLGIPTGIAFDATGRLYVGDRTGTVHLVEPQGATRPFARLPASVAAYHLAFGPDGLLYVTAPTLSNDDPVYRVSASGDVTPFVEHLARPQGLAFDQEGALYVVAICRGERGIFRIGRDRRPSLAVAGENLIGLTFDQEGRMVIASANAIYRLAWPLARAA
ncbi:MAG TPA: hypothetical protein VMG58_10875 [Candidatus Sulfotelmatobacter sp.]|nr:hypothetical protein [Candidatus Sulfotelmatobacter sp.]